MLKILLIRSWEKNRIIFLFFPNYEKIFTKLWIVFHNTIFNLFESHNSIIIFIYLKRPWYYLYPSNLIYGRQCIPLMAYYLLLLLFSLYLLTKWQFSLKSFILIKMLNDGQTDFAKKMKGHVLWKNYLLFYVLPC